MTRRTRKAEPKMNEQLAAIKQLLEKEDTWPHWKKSSQLSTAIHQA